MKINSNKWRRIEEIFHSSLEVKESERLKFIREKSNDDEEIFVEVEKLISAHEDSKSFIQSPVAHDALEILSNENNETILAEPKIFAGQKIGRFEILKLIGKGGMGEVFLARDNSLERDIALKILPKDYTIDSSRVSRFIREAKAASALNHPNILTIHEIGEFDGTHFIASEYVNGKTLSQTLSQDKSTIKRILKISTQIVSALQAAHEAGIVHRDIKPDNIMIRQDGIVKVLDFGLAKLLESEDQRSKIKDKQSTIAGMIMGTPNYMSPEQARGKEIDFQTDIFSFGIVLYEMVSGKLPFQGDSVNDIIASILTKEPESLNEIPPDLEKIVEKCLQKDKQKRYQTAKHLGQDLEEAQGNLHLQYLLEKSSIPNSDGHKTQILKVETDDELKQTITQNNARKSYKSYMILGLLSLLILFSGFFAYRVFLSSKGGETSKQIESIAVLPFVNKSENPDSEYLSDGLTETLIFRLSQLPNLKVRPSSSVIRFKKEETDPVSAAALLGVDAIVNGKIVQYGDKFTISIEFFDVRNNKSLGGERYERKMSDLLATQREIVTDITNKLQLKLSGEGEQQLAKKFTDSNEAYQIYLKGRYHFARRNKDDVVKAIEYYNQAIKIDPKFALAYAHLAEAYNHVPNFPYLSPNESIPQAKAAARHALEIDPMLAEAYTALATSSAAYDWNWTEAERNFKRAIELDPNNAIARFRYATEYLLVIGRSDEALVEIKRALDLAPLDLNILTAVARVYSMSGQAEKALEQSRKVNEIDPDFIIGRWLLGRSYNINGLYDEAIKFSQETLQKYPNQQVIMTVAGVAYAKSGRRQEAEEMIKKFREIEKTGYVSSYLLASVYVALDEREQAFVELNKAFQKHDTWLKWLKVDPNMKDIRNEPRYKEMMKRLNLPE